jgi:hypothetical protein
VSDGLEDHNRYYDHGRGEIQGREKSSGNEELGREKNSGNGKRVRKRMRGRGRSRGNGGHEMVEGDGDSVDEGGERSVLFKSATITFDSVTSTQ